MQRISLNLILLAIVTLLANCSSNTKPGKTDSTSVDTAKTQVTNIINKDTVELTGLVRKLYKWHETAKLKHNGFKALKNNPADTLYTSIDLVETEKAIEELKATGLFADSFLNDYRQIAARMDKELRNGSSLWPDGELSTFGDDSDAWCNCQDFPVDNYWNIIKLTNIVISNNEATFKWTWGGDFFYNMKAVKTNGTWKISYMQGFDMAAYSWEWQKKKKKP
jgi:hypothetical protein